MRDTHITRRKAVIDAIIHNFVRTRKNYSHEDIFSYIDVLYNENFISFVSPGTRPGEIRDHFKDYFVAEGAVSRQYRRI